MIKENLKNKFPTWYENLDPQKYYLVMSDDFDSYYSCNVLIDLFGLEIGGFYSFSSGLWLNKEKTEDKEPIYVDLSITRGKSFDNHVSFIKNPNAINPNIGIQTYFRKYNGSTLALICALYDYDVEKTNRLTTLLCVDGWYCGYYNQNGEHRDVNIDWFDKFGLSNKLLPILQAHDRDYFVKYAQKYNLNANIYMRNKKLQCSVNVPLPEYEFELALPVYRHKMSKEQAQEIYLKDNNAIFTSAETFKNSYILSTRG